MGRSSDFEAVALPHTAGLLRVARRLTLNATIADDLVQETLLLAWRGFHQFEAGSNVRAWLFRILMNAHLGNGRKLRRSPVTIQIVERPDAPEWEAVGAAPRLLDDLTIRQALDQLSEEHRTVLVLGVVEGLSCREMAEVLDLPIGTVMSRMSRARQAMRERLAPGSETRKTKRSAAYEDHRAEAL